MTDANLDAELPKPTFEQLFKELDSDYFLERIDALKKLSKRRDLFGEVRKVYLERRGTPEQLALIDTAFLSLLGRVYAGEIGVSSELTASFEVMKEQDITVFAVVPKEIGRYSELEIMLVLINRSGRLLEFSGSEPVSNKFNVTSQQDNKEDVLVSRSSSNWSTNILEKLPPNEMGTAKINYHFRLHRISCKYGPLNVSADLFIGLYSDDDEKIELAFKFDYAIRAADDPEDIARAERTALSCIESSEANWRREYVAARSLAGILCIETDKGIELCRKALQAKPSLVESALQSADLAILTNSGSFKKFLFEVAEEGNLDIAGKFDPESFSNERDRIAFFDAMRRAVERGELIFGKRRERKKRAVCWGALNVCRWILKEDGPGEKLETFLKKLAEAEESELDVKVMATTLIVESFGGSKERKRLLGMLGLAELDKEWAGGKSEFDYYYPEAVVALVKNAERRHSYEDVEALLKILDREKKDQVSCDLISLDIRLKDVVTVALAYLFGLESELYSVDKGGTVGVDLPMGSSRKTVMREGRSITTLGASRRTGFWFNKMSEQDRDKEAERVGEWWKKNRKQFLAKNNKETK